MKIVILMEDTKGEQEVSAEHGLSLYIETGHHKILADTGASDRTWENAGALGGGSYGCGYGVSQSRTL